MCYTESIHTTGGKTMDIKAKIEEIVKTLTSD